MSHPSEHRENGTLLSFCHEFGLEEEDLGHVVHLGRRCFLLDGSNRNLLEIKKKLKEKKKDIFGLGVYLGEEKRRFEPSPACIELIGAKTQKHKAIVDANAEWLFLCGRDLFNKAIVKSGEPTASGYLLIQNARDENLGYGLVPGARKKAKKIAIKNLLDRGFFLRRERLA